MAVKVFTIDMNGGDETSADTAIYFKIYGSSDSYTTAIATTGVHGTTGVSVSAGTATVTWEVGTETAFKVTQVDEAGNESLVSNEWDTAASAYLFEDLFTGTTIDTTTNWNKTELSAAAFEFTQNNALILTSKNNTNQASFDNSLIGQTGIDLSTIEAVTFDITHTGQNTVPWGIGITKDVPLSGNLNRIGIQQVSTAGSANIQVKEGGANTLLSTVTIDISTLKTIKITNLAGSITFYYWNGSAWTSLGTTTHTSTGNWYPVVWGNDELVTGQTFTVDNFRIVDTDFTTLRP